MSNADIHRFHTEIRPGSIAARPILRSEYIEIDYEHLLTDLGLENIRRAYSTLGFLTVRMPQIFVEGHSWLHDANKQFFALGDDKKNSVLYSSFPQPEYSNIGYYPMNVEKAQSHEVADRKEFIHIGRSPKGTQDDAQLYTDIPWPASLSDIASEYRNCYELFVSHAEHIFLAIAQAFGLDTEYCKHLVIDGNSILRNIHYPPVEAGSNAMRAAPHHGMNLIGVQVKSTHPGLQFCTHDDEWVYIDDWAEDLVTVNLGRMLAYILNGRAKPTLHRVVNDLDGSNLEPCLSG